ncbi:MAG TPA: undecaprenyldiphospho-muramoylpentapeptide beta-N-acetylglucosaminyltransferase [Alphaproteobacteria bacterium]
MSSEILLSAGGTGGHMFPAFALAAELKSRGIPVSMVTDARGTKYQNQHPDLKFHVVKADTLRPGLVAKIKMVAALLIGTGQAFSMLKRMKPQAVVGFGGYPSFPAILAAQALGIPTYLHEQNAVLGKANKFVAGRAKKIALSLPGATSMPLSWQKKVVVTGNPVRAELVTLPSYQAPDLGGAFNVLVLGGSQGATVFSKLLPEAIGLMPDKNRLNIVQQCRAADIGMVRTAYDVMNVKAKLETFITDVPDQMAAAHLIIARSGASTVAEVAAAGRPALFVPYPHHKDQQQKANAQVLNVAGGAVLLEEATLTAAGLAKQLEKLMQNPADLTLMAAAAKSCAQGNAASRLADVILGG